MNDSPAVILYDGYGSPVAIQEGDVITAIQPAYLVAGRDENDQARIIKVGDDGSLVVDVQNPITIDGYVNVQSIQDPVTVEGSVSIDGSVSIEEPVTVDGYVSIDGVVQTAPAPARAVEGRYFASTGIINGSNTSQLLMTLENPVSSGVTIYLTYADVNGTVSVNNYPNPFLYRISRLTGLPSGGTTLSEEQRSSSEGASLGIAREEPTGTGTGGSFWVDSAGIVRSSKFNRPKTNGAFETNVEDKEIVVQEGESIGVFADANSSQWRHYVSIRWNEVSL